MFTPTLLTFKTITEKYEAMYESYYNGDYVDLLTEGGGQTLRQEMFDHISEEVTEEIWRILFIEAFKVAA